MLQFIISALVRLGLVVTMAIFPGLPWFTAARAEDTNREACNVIQAAFVRLMHNRDLAYTVDVGAPSRSIARIESFVGRYGLGKDELNDLILQQDKYSIGHFAPVCDWSDKPQSVVNGKDPMRIEFSNPVLSSDSRLAIIQVSFRSHRLSNRSWDFGYGYTCVLRKPNLEWVPRCILGWIN